MIHFYIFFRLEAAILAFFSCFVLKKSVICNPKPQFDSKNLDLHFYILIRCNKMF